MMRLQPLLTRGIAMVSLTHGFDDNDRAEMPSMPVEKMSSVVNLRSQGQEPHQSLQASSLSGAILNHVEANVPLGSGV